MLFKRLSRNLWILILTTLLSVNLATNSQVVLGQDLPEIIVTTSRDVYTGSIEHLEIMWLSEGKLADTMLRDIEMLDDQVELCESKAKEDLLKCEIDVLEFVVEEEKDCSNLLDGWDAFQLNAELSVDVRVMGGSVSITTASPGDRNQSCVTSLNFQKELELKRCELNYRQRINDQCSFW